MCNGKGIVSSFARTILTCPSLRFLYAEHLPVIVCITLHPVSVDDCVDESADIQVSPLTAVYTVSASSIFFLSFKFVIYLLFVINGIFIMWENYIVLSVLLCLSCTFR